MSAFPVGNIVLKLISEIENCNLKGSNWQMRQGKPDQINYLRVGFGQILPEFSYGHPRNFCDAFCILRHEVLFLRALHPKPMGCLEIPSAFTLVDMPSIGCKFPQNMVFQTRFFLHFAPSSRSKPFAFFHLALGQVGFAIALHHQKAWTRPHNQPTRRSYGMELGLECLGKCGNPLFGIKHQVQLGLTACNLRFPAQVNHQLQEILAWNWVDKKAPSMCRAPIMQIVDHGCEGMPGKLKIGVLLPQAQNQGKVVRENFHNIAPLMVDQVTKIAEFLLTIQAVRLQPDNPFTWASGWKSPVYCDNRLTLSYPHIRNLIRDTLVQLVREKFPEADGVAGVATAGIPQGALVADHLGLPFIYIRSAPKAHGMTNQVEGRVEAGRKYVVVEDLISTGGSSIKAVEALRAEGGNVAGVVAVFNYGFPQAEKAFKEANCSCESLVYLEQLLQKAREIQYIQPAEMEVISDWRKDPVQWTLDRAQKQ
jgi:orotate phosphoribosyltransferase